MDARGFLILLLAPLVGDFRARQVAVFTGSALILAVAALFIRWMKPVDRDVCACHRGARFRGML